MQLLKHVLKAKFSKTHIEDQLRQAEHHLNAIQVHMHSDHMNPMHAEQEQNATENLRKVKVYYASYISQKVELNWLKYGDNNTKVFDKSIKSKRNGNTIRTLTVDGTTITEQCKIQEAFLKHFKGIICGKMENQQCINMDIIGEGPILNDQHRNILNLHFSPDVIKVAMWSISEDKVSGLDGYNSGFFKVPWDIIEEDIVQPIQEFFDIGVLLKAWNVTAITLIPKSACPNDPGDFRPISCCHVIYKCIYKMLCNRMKLVLNDIINSS